VTQVLFGETFSILEERGNWLLVSLHLDQYEGWIDRKQVMPVTDYFISQINHKLKHVIADKTGLCNCKKDGTHILLTKGSHLPLYDNGRFFIGEKQYTTTSKCKIIHKKFTVSKVASTAMDYLNVPYLWGGRSIMGVDCSGLVQIVYHICGLDLPRDASQQALKGNAIDFVDEALPGDLAFFDTLSGDIIHVGIIIGPGKILHASGRVKIDKIDHNGIFSSEMGAYSHSLRIIKRF
jgi:gamma-D-glutamyl-L-lysine dipeptidyl-peptidase